MNTIDTKDLERVISLYLDGELESAELKKFQEFLSSHPATAKEVEILLTAKKSLHDKKKLAANDWFWLKLSNSLEVKELRNRSHFFSSRPGLAITAAFVLIFMLIGSIYLNDAPIFHRFFVEKKNQMESTLLSGEILPFFSNLDKNAVLNFALFGSIPLDSATNTSLQVKNTSDSGSQIEIVHRDPANRNTPVTVADFYEKVGIVKEQQQIIVDSILSAYRQKLQGSVLVSENNEIAIHEQLADLNRAMVSTLAASLEPVQRGRFKKYLEVRQAPYAIVSLDLPKIESKIIFEKMPTYAKNSRYVVISKDTVGFAEVKMNFDSIRHGTHRRENLEQREMATKLLNDIASLHRQYENSIVVAGSTPNRVRVQSTDRAFQINLEAPSANDDFEMVDMVMPRAYVPMTTRRTPSGITVIGDSAFSFDVTGADDIARIFRRMPKGEFRFEVVDSTQHSPKVKITFKSTPGKKEFEEKVKEMRLREQELIDLDSLLRSSEKEHALPPKKQRKVFEL